MKILLITPPMTQLNTPYPATAYLTGFLRAQGVDVAQADPGLTWILGLLCPSGLDRWMEAIDAGPVDVQRRPSVEHVRDHRVRIRRLIPAVLAFLQGRDLSLAPRIVSRRYLPEGPRFANIAPVGHEEEYLQWAFGTHGVTDFARYLASLFIEDVADAIRDGVDPHFGFARYGESLALSCPTLEPLLDELGRDRVTSVMLDELTDHLLAAHRPTVVGMSLPFPGNVLGALRMARRIKTQTPDTVVVWGGGYVNTELRDVNDLRLFDFVDFVTFDDGERPLLNLIEHLDGRRSIEGLLRTRARCAGAVVLHTSAAEHDVPFSQTGTPTYVGLPLGDYLSMVDMLNPMHRLWGDTRWNKLTVAHGCYWKKCSFCDVTLDYIRNYDPLSAKLLVDRMVELIDETGERGFHLVDEAAPPAGLRGLAETLLDRGVEVTWWGNIRFERAFTPELCELLGRSGCIAVSGGLEVASNRLLGLMQKGVTVEQVARVTRSFADAGIKVHAYLMYGFPTQTMHETIDSLEMVRQLFVAGCLDSAYWHRFAATAHSPVGLAPEQYGIRLLETAPATFARNDLPFHDPTGCDHTALGAGLAKAVYNYMLGMGFDEDVRSWFEQLSVPRTTVNKQFIRRALAAP